MKISFENPDKINGLLTIVVEEEDYKNDVEKTLKDYRKKANVPGFRPGQAPMGMIKRQFGPSVKMEAVNKIIGQQIYKYVKEKEAARIAIEKKRQSKVMVKKKEKVITILEKLIPTLKDLEAVDYGGLQSHVQEMLKKLKNN